MPTTIAISGKGGTGKSTIAAAVVRWLNERGEKSVLAVDADPNVNLNDLLGAGPVEAVGTIREEMREKVSNLPGGMTKQQFLENKIHRSLLETPGFDLVAMGRPEGPGCYCYANSLLREILKTLSDNYRYVVIDNEAGMEHLSRRNTQRIDFLLVVSDPSVRSVQSAARIGRLLKELDTRVDRKYLIVNRVRGELPPAVRRKIQQEGLQLLAALPEDEALLERDGEGAPLYEMPAASPFFQALDACLSELLRGAN